MSPHAPNNGQWAKGGLCRSEPGGSWGEVEDTTKVRDRRASTIGKKVSTIGSSEHPVTGPKFRDATAATI